MNCMGSSKCQHVAMPALLGAFPTMCMVIPERNRGLGWLPIRRQDQHVSLLPCFAQALLRGDGGRTESPAISRGMRLWSWLRDQLGKGTVVLEVLLPSREGKFMGM